MHTYEPQPYASLDISQYLYNFETLQRYQKSHLLGAASFDRARGFLYVFQRQADGDKSLVHVWKVNSSTSAGVAVNVGGITTSLAAPPALGGNITFSFPSSGQTDPLYYQYWLASGYQTPSYGNWQLLKAWSTDATLSWAPSGEDHYVVVVWVTDDQNSGRYHQGGLSVETTGHGTSQAGRRRLVHPARRRAAG
jgi:hypothetical protein